MVLLEKNLFELVILNEKLSRRKNHEKIQGYNSVHLFRVCNIASSRWYDTGKEVHVYDSVGFGTKFGRHRVVQLGHVRTAYLHTNHSFNLHALNNCLARAFTNLHTLCVSVGTYRMRRLVLVMR